MVHPAGQRRQHIIDRLSGKKSKQETNYRPGNRDDNECCAECKYYTRPGEPEANCELVAGVIAGMDMCDLFERGDNTASESGVHIEINVGR